MNYQPSQKSIHVFADWEGLIHPSLVGILHATVSRGKEILSFDYSRDWLRGAANTLDPDLQLFSGRQYAPKGQDNFRIFLDSAPDRWGRLLMKRREAQLARQQQRQEQQLLESDYLLGVYDEHRMGALRFKIDPDGSFLDNNKQFSTPPWSSLRALERASLSLEQEGAENEPGYNQWLQLLIAPGKSLGGARPKASVVDEQQNLWIAKFPSAKDIHNVGAWELVVNNLAKRAGIIVAEATIMQFNNQNHTFLSKRFDRTDSGKRVHFASAITLLQRADGDAAANGASYLELADFIMRSGLQPEQNLEQLWRRIVFYIGISNVDDHLRNHGFILQNNGWILSPAFDINPVATGGGLTLNISETDNSQDFDLAMDVAKYFRIKTNKAKKIIQEIISVVNNWREEATLLQISRKEQDNMASAFLTSWPKS